MALRVLVIEDSEDDALLAEHALDKHFREPNQYRRVHTRASLEAALQEEGGWDAVICDYALPDPRLEWPEALNLVRRWKKGVLFLILSGVLNDDKGKRAIQDGADDYLEKGKLYELGPLVERWLRYKLAHEKHRLAVKELLDKLKSGDQANENPHD